MKIQQYVRALRLEFTLCSTLPFLCGSVLPEDAVQWIPFVLGLLAVVAAHLSANLMNDYADSKTGVDWSDKHFYKFFGGSKLIQQGIFTEQWYFRAALIWAGIAALAIVTLFVMLREPLILLVGGVSIVAGWLYSQRPVALSHRYLGEVANFTFFGPIPVCAGYYVQTGELFPAVAVYASLPYGFLLTAILFANEIPDYASDQAAGKHTWVHLTGPERAFIIYILLQVAAQIAIIGCVVMGIFPAWCLVALIGILPVMKAARIMHQYPYDKHQLIQSSIITIAVHALVGILLIVGSV